MITVTAGIGTSFGHDNNNDELERGRKRMVSLICHKIDRVKRVRFSAGEAIGEGK